MIITTRLFARYNLNQLRYLWSRINSVQISWLNTSDLLLAQHTQGARFIMFIISSLFPSWTVFLWLTNRLFAIYDVFWLWCSTSTLNSVHISWLRTSDLLSALHTQEARFIISIISSLSSLWHVSPLITSRLFPVYDVFWLWCRPSTLNSV